MRRVVEETLDFVARELRGAGGRLLLSALDADSEGVEGKFYVWTVASCAACWPPRTPRPRSPGSASPTHGNFDDPHHPEPGWNVLTGRGPEPPTRSSASGSARALLAARAPRVRPGLDDKRLTAWNALTIPALAEAGAVLGREDYVAIAARGARVRAEPHARRRRAPAAHLEGRRRRKLNAYLEDHAFLLEALLALYEATFEPRWFADARELADAILARFADPERGGFFSTSADHEQLVARRKDLEDTPIPSGSLVGGASGCCAWRR